MMKYSPPPSTRLLVAISESARAVGMVTICPSNMIRITPQNPRVPTAKPKRRNKIAPRIVETAVINTGAVPNFLFELILWHFAYIAYMKSLCNPIIIQYFPKLNHFILDLLKIFRKPIRTSSCLLNLVKKDMWLSWNAGGGWRISLNEYKICKNIDGNSLISSLKFKYLLFLAKYYLNLFGSGSSRLGTIEQYNKPLDQMKKRHVNRKKDIDRYYRYDKLRIWKLKK